MPAERLRQLRTAAQMTQKELADRLDLTPKMVSFYELGKRFPPHNVLAKIADIFQVSADYLLGRSDTPSPPDSPPESPLQIGTPAWLREMYRQIGVDVDCLSDEQVRILVAGTASFAQAFRDKLTQGFKE